MRTLLRELRSLLERERRLYGSFLPVDARSDPEPGRAPAASGDVPSGDVPSGDVPSGDVPSGDVPSGDVPSGDVPSGDMPSGDETYDDDLAGDAARDDDHDDDHESAEAPSAGDSSASDDGLADRDEGASEDAPSRAAPGGDDDAPDPGDASTAPSDDSDSEPMPNYDLFGNQVDPTEDPSLPPWERIKALVPDDAPYRDATALEQVEAYLADTVLVPIDEDRENPVFGVGDPESDLVIIGEAPGRDEDKEGEPFVGRAGTLLDKILDAINFERGDVYITNILKSRPPRNRNPKDEEVEAHLPILYKQIELIRPEIILCVGKVAGNTMLDRRSSLSNLRESEHDFYGIPLLVTYHPAALLRNPQWKRPTWEDVKLLRTRYDQLTDGAGDSGDSEEAA
jgi:DNA polymerase